MPEIGYVDAQEAQAGGSPQASLFPDLDDKWPRRFTSGVLPSQHIESLIANGGVIATTLVESSQIQPASLDLRLGPVGYRVRASFLPGARWPVAARLAELSMHAFDLTTPFVLERGCVYVVPLMEELALPPNVAAMANPKSSTGRLDVFTRLITDYGELFESVPPGYRGKIYVEIVPRTYSIRVRQGTKLNQMRFSRGGDLSSSDKLLSQLHREERIVFSGNHEDVNASIDEGLWFSVDLQESDDLRAVGFKARRNCPAIDLEHIAYYDHREFWDPVVPSRGKKLILNPDDFYILVSKERVRIPRTHAAEMVPFDPSVGEFRVHYAGFFDPGFGYGAGSAKGTPAVLEVRSHEVPFLLEDGQVVGRLRYKRLLEPPVKLYGGGIGSSYNQQGLALGKHFR